MLKRLAFPVVVAFAAIGFLEGQSAPNGTPKQGITKADHSQTGTNQKNSNNPDSPSQNPASPSSHPSSDTAKSDSQKENDELSIQRKVEWFTGILAFVGIVQSGVLVFTWLAVRRQADLQKFLTRQWVDIGKWRIDGGEPWEIDWQFDKKNRTAAEKSRVLKTSMSMTVGFEVFNRTANPIIISQVVILVGKIQRNEWYWRGFYDRDKLILPPFSPDGNNSEKYEVPFDLNEDEVFRYSKSGLYLRVRVRVFYLDSEGKESSQDFPMEVIFKENTTPVFYRYSNRKAKEIKEIQEQGSQNPN